MVQIQSELRIIIATSSSNNIHKKQDHFYIQHKGTWLTTQLLVTYFLPQLLLLGNSHSKQSSLNEDRPFAFKSPKSPEPS